MKGINIETNYFFNVGMATYKTAKYLANLLAPLGRSDCTIINTPDFINGLKRRGYQENIK